MKTLQNMVIALSILSSSPSLAQTPGSSREYSGRIKVLLSRTMRIDHNISPNALLILNTWGDGKVKVVFKIESKRNCPGIQRTYVGYMTATDSYNLYESTISNSVPTPNTAAPVGELVLSDTKAHLQFIAGFKGESKNRQGTCYYEVTADTAITLGN